MAGEIIIRSIVSVMGHVRDEQGEKTLRDHDKIYHFLEACPDLSGLTAISQPLTWESVIEKDSDNQGISGFVQTENGGQIAIHTFPHNGKLFLMIIYQEKNGVETVRPAMVFAAEIFGVTDWEEPISASHEVHRPVDPDTSPPQQAA